MTAAELAAALEGELRLAPFHEGGFSFATVCGRARRFLHVEDGTEGWVFTCTSDGVTPYAVAAELICAWWFDAVIDQVGKSGNMSFVFAPDLDPSVAGWRRGINVNIKSGPGKPRYPKEMPPQLEHAMKAHLTALLNPTEPAHAG